MVEALAVILLWPFIIFAVGLVVISLADFPYLHFGYSGWFLTISLLIVTWLLLRTRRKEGEHPPLAMQLEDIRRFLVGGSLVLLLPVFARYVIESFGPNPLIGILAAILTGFACVIFGMFMKENHLVARSSMLGGALTMLYVLSKVSLLDETGRVIAAALGLLLAITVAVVKFRERLT